SLGRGTPPGSVGKCRRVWRVWRTTVFRGWEMSLSQPSLGESAGGAAGIGGKAGKAHGRVAGGGGPAGKARSKIRVWGMAGLAIPEPPAGVRGPKAFEPRSN